MTGPDPRPLHGRRAVVVNWRDPGHHLAGGSERYAWELALGLRDAGARVEFWTARDAGQSARETADGIDVRRRGGQYSFYAGVWARLVADRVRRRPPDVVLDMDCGIPSFTPPLLGRGTSVVLVVHHVHQDQFRTAMRRPVSDLGRFLEGRLMPAVYRDVTTVAVSESTVTEMRRQLGWRGDVRVIHNGTDLPPAPTEVRTGERVVVLGRVVPHKRVELVVRAFARLLVRRPGATLDIVGTGPGMPAVSAAVAELGLGDSVLVHGFLPEEEKAAVLRAARLHVCASDAEGWGQVVLEAAAHGVPTLGRDVPGVRDSVRDGRTGWLVPESPGGDADELVRALGTGLEDALETLSDPRVASQVAGHCRSWAEEFGWARMRAESVEVVGAVLLETR
ncbi:glycosyltransferase family 4 protein [Nocardioides sp.]|uniref:glycosyltransferase family 4 protein n=1 Tax=Nocardioides sp. TaxID=35761 RepID=UPI001A2ED84B|nr:glycosyltransferase family 4 protein [Nocardioides sp.]MBJ7355933.1 glycosyltransferase family 4 protein [Nocardioides sp.]